MITADGRGILNDWDHSGRKDCDSSGVVSVNNYPYLASHTDHTGSGNLAFYVVPLTTKPGQVSSPSR